MAIFRTLTAAFRRSSDSRAAQDIVESGAARRNDSGTPAVTTPHSTQGVRPYGFGY